MDEKYEFISMQIEFGQLFGTNILLYKEKSTGMKVFATHIVPKADDKEFGIAPDVLQEITLQHELKHENVWRLLEYVHDIDQTVYLVYEHFEFNLKSFMRGRDKLDHHLIKKLLYQILSGLAYLHGIKRVHCQIRPENIIVGSDGETCKIADFRLVKINDLPPSHKEVDACYRAPEVLLDLDTFVYHDYKDACDVWSVGCLFSEMLEGNALISAKYNVELVREIFSIVPKPPDWKDMIDGFELLPDVELEDLKERFEYLEDSGFDLLSKMLCADPVSRITASKALNHKYFEDFFDGKDNTSTKVTMFNLLNSFYSASRPSGSTSK